MKTRPSVHKMKAFLVSMKPHSRGGWLRLAMAGVLAAMAFALLPFFLTEKVHGADMHIDNASNLITAQDTVTVTFRLQHRKLEYLQLRFIKDEFGGTGQGTGMVFQLFDAQGALLQTEPLSPEQLADTRLCTIYLPGLRKGQAYSFTLASTAADSGYRVAIGTNGAREIDSWSWAGNEEPQDIETYFHYRHVLRGRDYTLFVFLLLGGTAALVLPPVFKKAWQKDLYAFIVLGISAVLAVVCVETLAGTALLGIATMSLLLNLVLVAGLYLLLYSLTYRCWVAVLIGNLVIYGLGIVNHFTLQFRGDTVLPMDVLSAGTAFEVMANYGFSFGWELAITLAAFCFTLAAAMRAEVFGGLGRRVALSAGGVLLAVVVFMATTQHRYYGALGVKEDMWKPTQSSRDNGYLLNFMIFLGAMQYERPAGYSDEALAGLAEAYTTAEGPEETPNIFLIMNESLVDFNDLGELAVSQDYLPYIHRLEDSGSVYVGRTVVPVFGAGTSMTEFEALTGFSMVYTPAARAPYTQFVTKETPSLAHTAKASGYQTASVHLAAAHNWSRNTAYPYLGLDRFTTLEGFEEGDLPMLRGLPSDYAHYSVQAGEYEQRGTAQPYFSFSVTIQNHGGYHLPLDLEPITLTDGSSYPDVEQYMTLANQSDIAFEEFITRMEEAEEPTLVVMFGDHYPSVDSEFLNNQLGGAHGDLENDLLLYQTPLVIWANYEVDFDFLPERLSSNYLSAVVCRLAGLKMSAFQQFLADCMDQLPVFSMQGFVDSDGVYYASLEDTPYADLYRRYSYWQYAGIVRYETTNRYF